MSAPESSPPAILVIEDDDATLEYFIILLETSGYHVHGVRMGGTGWEYAMSAPVRAILLDRRLPDTDGLMLCRSLHERLGDRVPIIMMTADGEANLDTLANEAGATALLHKPFLPMLLLDALSVALRD